MWGGIFYDIVCSRFFGKHCTNRNYKLFTSSDKYSDSTVQMVTMMKVLNQCSPLLDEKRYMETLSEQYKKFNITDPSVLFATAIGWYASTVADAEHIVRLSSHALHLSEEKATEAAVLALIIFLAKSSLSKKEIEANCKNLCSIRQTETCVAFKTFLASEGVVDAVRNLVSQGGYTKTIVAMCGSFAEAYYGIDDSLIYKTTEFLPISYITVIRKFVSKYGCRKLRKNY